MLERFRRSDTGKQDHYDRRSTGTGATAVAERERTERTVVDREPRDGEYVDREPHGRAVPREHAREMQARQRDEFGGINWGSAFFGWLVAVGLAAILVGIVAAAGTAVGLSADATASDADTIGLAGGIALLVVMLIAYYAGGYVAGRMSRFDGAKQGLGVWLWGIIIAVVLAVVGVVLGSEYNVLSQLNLPNLPVGEQELTTGGIIAGIAILVGTLLAAVAGGLAGMRYHRRIDRVGVEH